MNKIRINSKNFFLLCLLMVSSAMYAQTPGSRYTGTYKKSGPIEYVNKKNIVIEGLVFENPKERAITLWRCSNITIRNCKFKNVTAREAILAEKGTNIQIIDCSFENVYGGFKAVKCDGNIKFEHNDVKNVVGDTKGGVVNLQAVQFNRCSGADNSISYNSIENIEGESCPDDNINIFFSHGTPDSPIRVANNWIRGGGPSPSGGGILIGDWGGSHQISENNIVVNPGQYGMGIAGGNNMTVRNNKIYSKQRAFTNVGMSICNWTQNNTTGKSYNIRVANNEVNWTHKDGYKNNWWIYENMAHLTGLETNKYNPKLNESILPDIIIGRARIEDDKEDDTNGNEEQKITKVYTDSFNRIAIKYFTSPIPKAYGELFTANGKKIQSMVLPRFNTVFPLKLSKGTYYVRVTYSDWGKTETSEISVN